MDNQPLFEIFMEGSAWKPGGKVDNMMALARSMFVPKNSGIQNVFPLLTRSLHNARMLRPPYRTYAIQKAQENIYGVASISSENGVMIRELNTSRLQRQGGLDPNTGQDATYLDEYLYGKEYLKNNKKTNAPIMEF